MPTITETKNADTDNLLSSTEVMERIYAETKSNMITFISKSIDRTAPVEDVEDIFIDATARLWDQVLSKHEEYDFVIAKKILIGMIKKQFFVYRNNSMNKISIDFLETVHKSGEDNMYNFEEDITDVPLYTPNEIYLREREKTPERMEHQRKKSARRYAKAKSDPILWRAYLDRFNVARRIRRAAKKNGTYVDRRLIHNKDIRYDL